VADLYDRLEEIQGMTRILTGDVRRLSPRLGERTIQAAVTDAQESNRRFYVRAVFALVEAVVEQHKRLILDLAARGAITVSTGVREALSERIFVVRDNGTVRERGQYLQLESKLRAVYRAAAEAFAQPLNVTFGDQGWTSFREALDVRDRITHPKTFESCHVDEVALDTVDKGQDWFRDLNNEFVRVARDHRDTHRW
jgi:uncharacterized protein (DUF1778 family)